MSISIKLPEDLRKRIARVVEDTDQSAHAFMVEAIRQETERAELSGARPSDPVSSAPGHLINSSALILALACAMTSALATALRLALRTFQSSDFT